MSPIQYLVENQGRPQLHGHGPWLVCEVALRHVAKANHYDLHWGFNIEIIIV